MKLKKLIKKAKKNNHKWVSVDKDGCAYSSRLKPEPHEICDYWTVTGDRLSIDYFTYLGEYTGKKNWKKTLRKVK